MTNKECKHNVKLAYNIDEIISYCDKCGKILDIKVSKYPYVNYYYGDNYGDMTSIGIGSSTTDESIVTPVDKLRSELEYIQEIYGHEEKKHEK